MFWLAHANYFMFSVIESVRENCVTLLQCNFHMITRVKPKNTKLACIIS